MKTKSGFTIVELLIVIVVIAILAAISVVAYNGVQNRAAASSVSTGLKQVENALRLKMTADDRTTWWLDNEVLGWANPRIQQMIDGTDLSNYIQRAPSASGMPTANYTLDSDGDTYNGCTTNTTGVNIIIYGFTSPQVAQIVDDQIDDGNLACGKVTLSGTALRYVVSPTPSM